MLTIVNLDADFLRLGCTGAADGGSISFVKSFWGTLLIMTGSLLLVGTGLLSQFISSLQLHKDVPFGAGEDDVGSGSGDRGSYFFFFFFFVLGLFLFVYFV